MAGILTTGENEMTFPDSKEHLFVVQVKQRDDLPDSQVDSDFVRNILLNGSFLEVIAVWEIQKHQLVKGESSAK